jgi:acyl-CoA reductase-like NAD-dependent aldehyde dehydrogenase
VATDSCKLAIKELKKWMAPQKVPITLIAFPGTAEVIPEPFGVALIISPWNFPFCKLQDLIISTAFFWGGAWGYSSSANSTTLVPIGKLKC